MVGFPAIFLRNLPPPRALNAYRSTKRNNGSPATTSEYLEGRRPMSRLLQLVLAIGLGFVYTSHATAGDDDARAKVKGKRGAVHGVVQSVDEDSITVKVHQRKKGSGSGGANEEKTFKIGT